MVTTVLVEHPWLSPAALVALVVVGPVAGAWLAGHPTPLTGLTALSWLPVAVLTLVPTDRRAFEVCEVAWSLPTPGRVELAANVVLFVAPVLLLGVLLGRPGVALLAASGLSVLVEVVQAAVPALGRSCSTNDWLSNTIGALIGSALAMLALRLAGRGPASGQRSSSSTRSSVSRTARRRRGRKRA